MKFFITIVILLSSLNHLYSAAQVDFCYTIDERSRNLYRVAQDGSQYATIGQIQECRVEAIAWDRISELWMFDAGTSAFYTLDIGTATSTFKHAAPTCIRSDNGTVHQISDVDALDFDAFNSNILWAVDRVTGGQDLLFALDIVTGQVIGNTCFPVTGVGLDIEDIGVDPLTGTMYAIANINGIDYLIVLDTLSGAGFIIGPLIEAGVQVTDMEGFGFDVDGQLIGTTGECSDRPGSLYFINKGTGAVSWLRTIDMVNNDIESIACFNSRVELRALLNSSSLKVDNNNCPQCPDLKFVFIGPTLNNIECFEVEGSCPDGSTLEYRVDDGAWTEVVPTSVEQMTMTIAIRCLCDVDHSMVSGALTNDASFSYANVSYCIVGSEINPTITGLGGGTFSAAPIGLNIDPSTGAIDAATSIPGDYAITYTTAGECPKSDIVSLTIPELASDVTVTTSTVLASCGGVADGSATAIASGDGSFSYSWSNNGSGSTISNIPAGNYTVTITQSPSGCSIIETVVVPSSGGITWTMGFPAAIDETCVGDHDGAVGALATNGAAPYTYNWEDTAGNPLTTISGLAPGTYFVTATDTDGCIVSGSATVNPGITLNWANGPSAMNTTCPGADDGTVLAIAGGGTAPYTYDWVDNNGNIISSGGFIGNGSNDNTAGLSPGIYCVTATDDNGCTISGCATIVDGAGLTWSSAPTATDESCLGANDGSVFASLAGASSYVWTDAMGNTVGTSSLAGGSYFVVATDANGCTISGTATVAPGEFEYTMPNGNMLTGTQSFTEDYEVEGAIESDQLVNGGAAVNVDYDSGTCITLKAGFEVVSSSVFHAFIDGCGGAMLRENNENSESK